VELHGEAGVVGHGHGDGGLCFEDEEVDEWVCSEACLQVWCWIDGRW
jgi:hypothetical protein